MRDGSTLVGTFTWDALNVGGLGYVTDVVHATDGSCSGARTDVGGAYRREGTSGRWTQIITTDAVPSNILANPSAVGGDVSGVWELGIAPSNPAIWWMFFRGRALRSADRGATWADTNLNGTTGLYMESNGGIQRLTANKHAIDPSNPEIVYCGSQRDGLWRRMSGAWAQIATVPAASAASDNDKKLLVAVDPTSSLTGAGATSRRSVVYASSHNNGIYRSTDGGDTFALMSGHPGAGGTYDASCVTIDQNGLLYVCLNTGAASNIWRWNGTTWSNLTTAWNVRFMAVDPKDANRIVGAQAGSSPVLSLNAGSTWTGVWNAVEQQAAATSVPIIASVLEAGFRASTGASVAAIKPHPTVAKDFIAMGLGTMYFSSPWPAKSADTRLTWVEDAAGIEELVAHDATITPNGDTLLCSHDKAIIRAMPDGSFPAASYPVTTLTNGYKVDWAIDDPNWLVCMVAKNGNHSGYSTDGGRSWTAFPSSYGTAEGGTIAVSNKAQIVVSPGQNRWPKYSHDFGVTWTDCTFAGVTRIADGSESGFGFGTTNTRRQHLCADKDAPGTFYIYNYGPSGSAAIYQGIWKSTDGGINFTRVNSTTIVPSGTGGFHLVLKCVEGDLYLTPGDTGSEFTNDVTTGFYKSVDGGVNWTTVPGMSEVTFAFGKAPPGGSYPTLYMYGWKGGVKGLYRSYDGGATSELIDYTTHYNKLWAIAADPTKFGRVVTGYSGTGWQERTYEYTMRLS